MDSSSGSPSLCARSCGFFGSEANNGLCSACYKNYLKEKMAASESTTLDDSLKSLDVGIMNELVSSPVVKKRCGCCNKKVGLLGFSCRCGGTFCGAHRYAESHHCDFDFKTFGKLKIEKENLVIKADKIEHRV